MEMECRCLLIPLYPYKASIPFSEVNSEMSPLYLRASYHLVNERVMGTWVSVAFLSIPVITRATEAGPSQLGPGPCLQAPFNHIIEPWTQHTQHWE